MSFFGSSNLHRYLHTSSTDPSQTSWAMITGSSDGIGLGFATALAQQGFNLILHGRNATKLDAVRTQLFASYPSVQIRTAILDAVSANPSDITTMTESLNTLPITVLINNVGGAGVLNASFKSFSTHTLAEIDHLINLNIRFTALLTAILLPTLRAQSPALIINTSSQSRIGMAYIPVYSSTKAFIHAFSHALSVEFSTRADTPNAEVEVLEILVGSVQTQQNQTAKPTFFVPDAITMAKSALSYAGKGSRSVASYWPHRLQQLGYSLLPQTVLDWLVVSFLKPLAGKEERVW